MQNITWDYIIYVFHVTFFYLLTSQEVPSYPGGHWHTSTARAWTPVWASAAATCMLTIPNLRHKETHPIMMKWKMASYVRKVVCVLGRTCRWRSRVPDRMMPAGAHAGCCWERCGSLSYWQPILSLDAENFLEEELSSARPQTPSHQTCCQSNADHHPNKRQGLTFLSHTWTNKQCHTVSVKSHYTSL